MEKTTIKRNRKDKEYKNMIVVLGENSGGNSYVISNCKFEGCTIISSKYDSVICAMEECSFNNCKFDTNCFIRFTKCRIENCIEERCFLYKWIVDRCYFKSCEIKYTALIGSLIEGTTFDEVKFHEITSVVSGIRDCKFFNCWFYGLCFDENFSNIRNEFDEKCGFGCGCEKIYNGQCPTSGSFIGWKVARYFEYGEEKPCIVKLLIPEDALRLSSYGRKCRASKAKVIAAYKLGSDEELGDVLILSMYDYNFKYEVGNTIESKKKFDSNREHECSSGIHFFLSRFDAEAYCGENMPYTKKLFEKINGLKNH